MIFVKISIFCMIKTDLKGQPQKNLSIFYLFLLNKIFMVLTKV
jgi:hypothetical protein